VRNKATTERLLFRMHQSTAAGGDLPAAVCLRAGNPFYREAFFWDRCAPAGRSLSPATATG
jgi:hypothetical protein